MSDSLKQRIADELARQIEAKYGLAGGLPAGLRQQIAERMAHRLPPSKPDQTVNALHKNRAGSLQRGRAMMLPRESKPQRRPLYCPG